MRVSRWNEEDLRQAGATWAGERRRAMRTVISIGDDEKGRSLVATVERVRAYENEGEDGKTLDEREFLLAKGLARRASEVLHLADDDSSAESLMAIKAAFDEQVVAQYLAAHHKIDFDVLAFLSSLHRLAEQTYENKQLAFGCIIDPELESDAGGHLFPEAFFSQKKYRALSDGFNTAYHASSAGGLHGFVDLARIEYGRTTDKHYYPEWCERIASASLGGRLGFALTRHGDLLVFNKGTLRFTYRFGRWQYRNHAHLIEVFKDLVDEGQSDNPAKDVAKAVYRAALDASFRRSGALFVVLRDDSDLHDVVRSGDAIGDNSRGGLDHEFDRALPAKPIQQMDRKVVVELSALDGAVVVDSWGEVLAYGAVLRPRRAGRLKGTEGSRTKAAIGASNYGLAVKVSSDGDIVAYWQGDEALKV